MKNYTIWDEMRRIQREMDSLFDDFVYSQKPYLLSGSKKDENSLTSLENYREPVCDVKEDNDKYNLSLEIPGSKKEDIKINVNDNNLEIKVEHTNEEKKEEIVNKKIPSIADVFELQKLLLEEIEELKN